MKIKRSEQELAYLEKREREVGLWWWADLCLSSCARGNVGPGRPSIFTLLSVAWAKSLKLNCGHALHLEL